MKDLDKKFGKDRVIDTPVSELAVTGAAVGAAINGARPIVLHPRMDFMVLATDPIINQAAKWRHIFNNKSIAPVVIRSIINRGGEQGAQHSQSLHSWFAHIPGLRTVMPATVQDAYDSLVWAVKCDDPVLYIDDRWLYDVEGELLRDPDNSVEPQPQIRVLGHDITLVGAGWASELAAEASKLLHQHGISAEVIDLRAIGPVDHTEIANSVAKTGRLIAVDAGWQTCGLSSEIIAGTAELLPPSAFKASPQRITIANCPAPAASSLEDVYYPSAEQIVTAALNLCQ